MLKNDLLDALNSTIQPRTIPNKSQNPRNSEYTTRSVMALSSKVIFACCAPALVSACFRNYYTLLEAASFNARSSYGIVIRNKLKSFGRKCFVLLELDRRRTSFRRRFLLHRL